MGIGNPLGAMMKQTSSQPWQTPPYVPTGGAQSAAMGSSSPSMPRIGGGTRNALGELANGFLKGFAPEQYAAGQQERQQRALAEAMKSQDYGTASNLMYDMGNIDGGLQLAQMGKPDPAKQREQAQFGANYFRQMKAQMDSQGEAFDPYAYIAADPQGFQLATGSTVDEFYAQTKGEPLDPAELDQIIARYDGVAGVAPEQPEAYTLAPGARRYEGDQQIAANPVAPKPASPLGKIMADVSNGILTQEQADAEIARLAQRGDSSAQNVQSTFVDENGQLNLVYRNGTIQGSGMQVQNPFQITDVGGVPTAINRRTGQGISISTPQEVGTNKATVETIVGNEADRRSAQKDLPAARLKLDQTIDVINQLVDHPGFDSRYGMRSIIPAIPGTPGADAQALIDQVGGQAFLQAFETLKGGGQITENEGNKATQALIRATKQGVTPDEARKAYKEFIYWANKGFELAAEQASGSYAPQAADAPPLKYNPTTGEFE